ncbi:hypothetical protein NGRA_3103 [Nosema granulosis]|uniref:Uncharacterized protein n=1 Tax=Nosema granulosis TaxID=83296 RepID=A0A9P6KXH7_9MICR|nr:hypothetical protein NGRA_3103 [Nosema granulosis]
MTNTRIKRVAGEPRSQEARMLLKEALKVEMRIKLLYECDKVELRKVVEIASSDLQDYIFEKFSRGLKDWDGIVEQLKKDEEAEMIENVIETVMNDWTIEER